MYFPLRDMCGFNIYFHFIYMWRGCLEEMTEQKRLRMSLEHVPRQVKMKFSQNTYYSNLICPTFWASEIFCSLLFSLINAKAVVSFVCKFISFSLKSCLWSYMVFWHLCDFIVIFKTNKLPIKVFKMIIIV